jgi:precorrin-2/cobalt-factor-2 C20-methyltransferase
MKAYRNAGDISDALEEQQMINSSVAVANCGLDDEEVIEDVKTLKHRKPGYWTLILAKKHTDHEAP